MKGTGPLVLAGVLLSSPAVLPGSPDTPPVADPALRRELLERVSEDQAIRKELIRKGAERPDKSVLARMEAIDAANATRMRVIVREHGWPGRALVGADGASAALMLVQHADPAFQREMLPLVEAAYQDGDLAGPDYALLLDRVLVGEGKPQVYGTQARPLSEWKGGEPVLEPIGEEADVDRRRAEAGLPPLAEYKALLRRAYLPREERK